MKGLVIKTVIIRGKYTNTHTHNLSVFSQRVLHAATEKEDRYTLKTLNSLSILEIRLHF